MAGHRTELFVHLVWATVQRLPLLQPDIERRVHRCIQAQVLKAGAKTLAIGGAPDHVHLLVAIPTTLSIADLLQQVKGASSQAARRATDDERLFRWHHGAGSFSVSPELVPTVRDYIRRQKEHHADGDLREAWERWDVEPDAAGRRPVLPVAAEERGL